MRRDYCNVGKNGRGYIWAAQKHSEVDKVELEYSTVTSAGSR